MLQRFSHRKTPMSCLDLWLFSAFWPQFSFSLVHLGITVSQPLTMLQLKYMMTLRVGWQLFCKLPKAYSMQINNRCTDRLICTTCSAPHTHTHTHTPHKLCTDMQINDRVNAPSSYLLTNHFPLYLNMKISSTL